MPTNYGNVTLLQLRTWARQRCDQENSTLWADSDVNTAINRSIMELYDLIVSAYGDEYYLSSYTNTTASGTASYAILSGIDTYDFYKLLRVDMTINGKVVSLAKFRLADEDSYKWNGNGTPVRYRLEGNNVVFVPTPDAAYSFTVYYIPNPVPLSSDTDTWSGVNGWDEYVVVDVAKKMATKEENWELVQALTADKALLADRVRRMAPARDVGNPETIRITKDEDAFRWDVIEGRLY